MYFQLGLIGLIFAILSKVNKDDPEALWWIKFFRKILGTAFLIGVIIQVIHLI